MTNRKLHTRFRYIFGPPCSNENERYLRHTTGKTPVNAHTQMMSVYKWKYTYINDEVQLRV